MAQTSAAATTGGQKFINLYNPGKKAVNFIVKRKISFVYVK